MATVESIIGTLQGYEPDDKIEDLLLNQEFMNTLRESFNSLPNTSRIAASKIVRKRRQGPKQKPPSSKALRAIQSVKEISLPEAVQERYKVCQQEPSKFWIWAGIQLDLENRSVQPIEIFLPEAYLGITRLETQRQWDTINWRFFVIFFHDLVNSFGKKYLTPELENELVAALTSATSVIDTTEQIRKKLKHWVICGSKYAKLSESLGDGAPFLLPQTVTDRTWEGGLPIHGEIHNKAVEHLVSIRIREESEAIGADIVGTKIRQTILKPFLWRTSTFNFNAAAVIPQDQTNQAYGQPYNPQYSQSTMLGATGLDMLFTAASMTTSGESFTQPNVEDLQETGVTTYPQRELREVQSQHHFDYIFEASAVIPAMTQPLGGFNYVCESSPSVPTTLYPNGFDYLWQTSAPISTQIAWDPSHPIHSTPTHQVHQ